LGRDPGPPCGPAPSRRASRRRSNSFGGDIQKGIQRAEEISPPPGGFRPKASSAFFLGRAHGGNLRLSETKGAFPWGIHGVPLATKEEGEIGKNHGPGEGLREKRGPQKARVFPRKGGNPSWFGPFGQEGDRRG